MAKPSCFLAFLAFLLEEMCNIRLRLRHGAAAEGGDESEICRRRHDKKHGYHVVEQNITTAQISNLYLSNLWSGA
jgi:hypothetical protein